MKVNIRIRRAEDAFVATCPVLPGCTCSGQTEDQAKDRLKEAIEGYLASINEFVPQRIDPVLEYQS